MRTAPEFLEERPMEKHTISALIIAGATLLIGIVQALILRAARRNKKKKP